MGDTERIDATVHKYDDMPVMQFGDGIQLRRVRMKTMIQTWIEIPKGGFSPLHRHEDEQTIVLIKGRLRARSGPNGFEIYTDMEPGDILEVPSMVMHQVEALEDAVFSEAFGPGPMLDKEPVPPAMRKQQRAEEATRAGQQA